MTTPTRSALFVDFDNVYGGLGGNESSAAVLFAEQPGRWMDWLSAGGDRPGARQRRFLVKVCYLSESYGEYRRAFVESGFRVVDCPTLTGAGKNGADIQLVIDALDALAADTRYDEFVIASADADFAPLLHRLRAHDRRLTVLRAGQAAPSYTSLCDSHISREQFAGALVDGGQRLSDEQPASPQVPTQRRSDRGTPEAAVAAVRQAVADSPVPVTGNAAAQAAQKACAGIAPGWGGARTFGGFVTKNLVDLRWTGKPSPGYVYDPTRHQMSDLQVPTR